MKRIGTALFALLVISLIAISIAVIARVQSPTIASWIHSTKTVAIGVEHNLSKLKQRSQKQFASFRSWYGVNRNEIVSSTEWAKSLRQSETYSFALLLLAVSVLLWGRENARQLKDLFSHLVTRDPVPFNKKIGVKKDYLTIVRQVIFYSCLYILYELISRFLAFRNDSDVAFYSNLTFRATLIVLLLCAHRSLKKGILNQKTLSDDQQETLLEWFEKHFATLNVSAGRVRRLAISIFLLTIGPSILLHIPQLLDFIVSL